MKKRKCTCHDELIDLPSGPDIINEEVVKEVVPGSTKEAVKKITTRKPNAWINLCKEVQGREENAGKSYREIMKIAKLEYTR
jgi:hypothetical protein